MNHTFDMSVEDRNASKASVSLRGVLVEYYVAFLAQTSLAYLCETCRQYYAGHHPSWQVYLDQNFRADNIPTAAWLVGWLVVF